MLLIVKKKKKKTLQVGKVSHHRADHWAVNKDPQCPCPSTPPVNHCHSRLPATLTCRLFVIFMFVRNVTYFRSPPTDEECV